MKAISIRQPWAWLIVNDFKDIENRSWDTKYRGLVLIHASTHKVTLAEYAATVEVVEAFERRNRCHVDLPRRETFNQSDIMRGGIVGYTHITGTTRESASPWFFGPVGFQLSGSKPLPFQPLKGRLSFFETGYGVVAAGRNEALIPELNLSGVKL